MAGPGSASGVYVPPVRILPCADSPARPEALSCLPKKVPKEGHPDFAREPRSGRAGPAALNSLRCASLRHPAPSPGPSRPPRGAPYGKGRSRQRVFRPHDTTTGIAARKPPGARPRARHATAAGRACPGCRNRLPPTIGKNVGIAVVWTYPPLSSRRAERVFAGRF